MKDKILKVLRKQNKNIDETTELIESGIINSFDLTNIVIELEDVLDIEIPFEEITAHNFKDVEAIEKLLEKL